MAYCEHSFYEYKYTWNINKYIIQFIYNEILNKNKVYDNHFDYFCIFYFFRNKD